MIYTTTTKKAMEIMYKAHRNQVDKAGMPYVFHPIHVAEQMKDENTTVVALLHDTIEDTDLTLEELEEMGFNHEVLEALKLMTHNEDIDYFDYIIAIGENDISRAVKIEDLKHNMDLSRLNKVTYEDLKRLEKYKKSLEYLQGIELSKKQTSIKSL